MVNIDNMKNNIFKLIDDLKTIINENSLGNSPAEYSIITQLFLYKFLNDKFTAEVWKNEESLNHIGWEKDFEKMSENEIELLLMGLDENIFKFKPEYLLSNILHKQGDTKFYKIFDDALDNLSKFNEEIFFAKTVSGTNLLLFSGISQHINDEDKKSGFAKACINKLSEADFIPIFQTGVKYDFFSSIFEYLIKDYNMNGAQTYAEYYTPHSIATIMAKLLVGNDKNLTSIDCYDPAAGTGTLLMALAHEIGENKCNIYSQDRSQKSTDLLKLNLIINGLIGSLANVVEGDTLTDPYHRTNEDTLKQFDFVVSNPPFKLDFSNSREKLALLTDRFWAGVPNVPAKKKEAMAIYTLFIQHLLNSLNDKGKGAIVVPSGFITAKTGIENKILTKIVDEKWVYGVVSMPSNVFATTGTNVSVLFFDKNYNDDKVILIDASKMGEEYQEGNNKKKRLKEEEINKIVDTFLNKKSEDDFSVCVTYDEIVNKNYSLSAGAYFDIKIEYIEITEDEFNTKMTNFQNELESMFKESESMSNNIIEQLKKVSLSKD